MPQIHFHETARAGKHTEYEVETGKNEFSRGREQAGGFRMHCQLEHGGEKVEFSLMARQVK